MIEELTPEERKVATSIRLEDHATGWVVLVCGILGFLGVGIFGWQCVVWLQDAEWHPLSWADGFAWMGAGPLYLPEYRGAEKILRWLGELPLCWLPVVVAFAITFYWFRDHDQPERNRVRGKVARIAARNAKGAPSGTDKAL